MQLIAVGDILVDVLCDRLPPAGQRVHGTTSLRAGGSTVNAALAATDAGASATVVGRIGSDPAGDLIVAALTARGVAVELARDPDLPTGVAVSLQADGATSVVADRGANAALSPDDVPPALSADALLVSGFALFQSGSRDAARAALERFDGPWSAVDLASPKLAAGAELEVGANVVFATAVEANAVTGLEPEAAARELAKSFTVACVKLGAEGAVAVQGGDVQRAKAAPVVGTSQFGAGDAFAAVFLVRLAGGDRLGTALEHACVAGARAAGSG